MRLPYPTPRIRKVSPHAELAALEAEKADGSAILASDEDFRSLRDMADFANRVRTFREAFSPGDFAQYLGYGVDDRPRDGA